MEMPKDQVESLILKVCVQHNISPSEVFAELLCRRSLGASISATQPGWTAAGEIDDTYKLVSQVDATAQPPKNVLEALLQAAKVDMFVARRNHNNREKHAQVSRDAVADEKSAKQQAFAAEWRRRQLARAEALAMILQTYINDCERRGVSMSVGIDPPNA